MAAQRNAHAFFEKYERSEVQDLLASTTSSWLVSMDDVYLPLQLPSGLITQLKNLAHPNVLILAPVEPEINLDYREIHQIIRELAVGIYCFNQAPSISLDANFDKSTSCQLPPAYYDTRVGQILISVDYMIKALWHGAYMPKEKRVRFAEFWKSSMDIDANGHRQTKKNIFEEFCTAGLIDISSDPTFNGIYNENTDTDPTYDPNKPEEKKLFMHYAESMAIKMTCFTTQVSQYENLFVYDASYLLSNVVRLTEDHLDSVTYQHLQQRLRIHEKLVKDNLQKKAEIHKNIAYLKLISFLIPFLLGLKKKMKVPDFTYFLQSYSDDKVKTERELPPLMLGPEFNCQHFQYDPNEYFHLHGGIEFDLGTPSLEPISEEMKVAYEDIKKTATNHINILLESDTTYREYYPIPVMEFNGKSYYAIAVQLEDFYQPMLKRQWWGAINGIISTLKPKRLPLTDIQLLEQFKKRFGYKKALKCKNGPFGLKSAAERGLAAIFYTFCRKTPLSGLSAVDESGYTTIHHAAIHNRVAVVSQLAKAGMNLNVRRSDHYSSQGLTALHLTAQCSSLEVLSCLLALNADYMLHDSRGWMAIHFAAFYGSIPCIRALYRKDAALLEMETAAEYQTTPLLLTAISGTLDTLTFLLSLGANWKAVDSAENNIIHLATLYFHTSILKYIIDLQIPELNVWQHLVEMLKSNNSYRVERATRCLEVLCILKETYWENIFEAGSIPCLVKLLSSGKVTLECLASGILSNISYHVQISRALVESGAVPILITLLSSQQPELQSRCSVILSDIAQVDSNQCVIAEMGGISPLVKLLNEEFEDVLVNAVNCIQVLCTKNPANQKSVKDLGGIPYLVEFLSSKSDVLVSASSTAIAELARGNKLIQDAISKENAVSSLINVISRRKICIQVKAALAVESLAYHNAAIQKQFLDKSVTKHLCKLLKVFQLEVREQGSTALWALAGQTLKQQKEMARRIGFNYIIDMLLSSSDKMQCIGGEAIIALSKDSKQHQDQICKGNGIGPLVRLLRNSKVAEGTLLSIIKALGAMCSGIAHTNNPVAQNKIVEEEALPALMLLLKTHSSLKIKVEVVCTLACIGLRNSNVQSLLQEKEHFKFTDIFDLLYSSDKDISLRAGYALTLFAFNNTIQQFYLLETGGIEIAIYESFLESDTEADQAMASFQIVVLAKVIVDEDHVTLSARGITILTELLKSSTNPDTLVLVGELLASLVHSRAGIAEVVTTLGTVECLCKHLYAEEEEVQVSCANALGYLTFNRSAYRHLLMECRNRPQLYALLINNLSKDAKISKDFTEEFKIQQYIGLPSLSLTINGGPPINSSSWEGKYDGLENGACDHYKRRNIRSKSAVNSRQKCKTADPNNRTVAGLPLPLNSTAVRPKTAHLGNIKPFQQKIETERNTTLDNTQKHNQTKNN
ncbi:ankyrin and armadillo repeat-containing protein [Bombina bombina]|uniref:ankyrin and armadillo repeat-containing protein n=1 Tax=Bombina bombina TaxID=8345 RepID=UPI00235AA91D|nr:ankyrin and armadillo repeat-containing protein [Bombina bombina]